MTAFDNLIGKKIIDVRRLDTSFEYEFNSPQAIIFYFDDQESNLIIFATNDGSSIDIKLSSDRDIEDDFGIEYQELFLNKLNLEDELTHFIGDSIEEIKIAEYISSEILGIDFIIIQGKFAGVELVTSRHKLQFRNNHGGWFDIDDDIDELPDKDRWRWKY